MKYNEERLFTISVTVGWKHYFAQSPIERLLNTINRSSAEATINFLASDELQGREAGFHGSRVTSEYIVSLLQWMGVSPLADSYFQPFDAYRKERQKKDVWKYILIP